MTKSNYFSLFFFINRSKIKKDGECPIRLRITIDGCSVSLNLKRSVSPDNWNVESGMANGKSPEIRALNRYIDAVRAKAYEKHTELMTSRDMVSAQLMRDAILGINSEKPCMIIDVWHEHNKEMLEKSGKDGSISTWRKYVICLNYYREFLEKEYKQKNLPMKLVNREMILKFDRFLRVSKLCGYNTVMKYLQQFKKIVRIGLNNGWIKTDPFFNIKLAFKEVDRPYLDDMELRAIIDKKILIPRLDIVRDLFIFSCFTGLAYVDMAKLLTSEFEHTPDGTIWIRTRRQKTGVRASIPLLNEPKHILKKYSQVMAEKGKNSALPMISNQKMNSYLKELADICGIEKNLTFHCARHTFATTVTLLHGVPIESVSKMLGHKDLKHTQHYARIVDQKVDQDMKKLAIQHDLNPYYSSLI